MPMPIENYVPHEIFGGAITLSFPPRFVDVSDFRPVPDHQEVWADANCDESIIVEILERAAVGDAQAGDFFFTDLASVGGAFGSVVESVTTLNDADVPGLTGSGTKLLVCGKQLVSKGHYGPEKANEIQVLMAILRLQSVATDLLVIINTPLFFAPTEEVPAQPASLPAQTPAETGALASPDIASHLLRQILLSLQVRDWGLFGSHDVVLT